MLLHAPWGGRGVIEGATVLDAFAGTGALGLEALSRGAGRAVFMEHDRGALAAVRANIAACGAADRCSVVAGDVLAAPAGERCGLVFLDPPYGRGLVELGVARLMAAGWMGAGTLVVAEVGREEAVPAVGALLAERAHGAARVLVWRMA